MCASIQFGNARLAVPEGFRPMTAEEARKHFLDRGERDAWINAEARAIVRVDEATLVKKFKGVDECLSDYQALYARMAPGFQAGEMARKDIDGGSVGILTFKSNAVEDDLFNVLALVRDDRADTLSAVMFTCLLGDASSYISFWSKAFAEIVLAGEEDKAGVDDER